MAQAITNGDLLKLRFPLFPVKWKGGPESEDKSSRNLGFQLIGLVSIYGQYAAIEMGISGIKQGS